MSDARAATIAWTGEWWTAIVLAERRGLAERRQFRAEMTKRLMGELRPDVWLRPANVARPVVSGDVLVVQGRHRPRSDRAWRTRCGISTSWRRRRACSRPRRTRSTVGLTAEDRAVLPRSFIVSVAVARFLAVEPHLPSEIVGARLAGRGAPRSVSRPRAPARAVAARVHRRRQRSGRMTRTIAVTSLDRNDQILDTMVDELGRRADRSSAERSNDGHRERPTGISPTTR